MEIKRDRYLKQLIESRQNGFIKVVTLNSANFQKFLRKSVIS